MTSSHSAAGSALGYAYQTSWALFELLRRGPDMPDARVSLEMHDDVAWDEDGSATERLQLKHHLNAGAAISDKGSDLWRTFRVWLDEAVPSDPDGPLLVLVTTAVASETSGVYRLRPSTLDLTEAQRLLELAASKSEATDTAITRQRFLELPPHDRQIFLSRVRVVDGAPQVTDVDAATRRVLNWAIPRLHANLFMDMLWGWWNKEALAMMQGLRGSVSADEVHDQLTQIRDQFASDRLPTLLHLSDVDPVEMDQILGSRTFVAQLRLIDWPPMNLQRALVDYYRAFVHETRWVDEDLIGLAELGYFNDALVDEWRSEFEFMQLELAEDASEADLRNAGAKLLRQLLSSSDIRVRPRYDEQFFARGKRHALADSLTVGWHPHFASKLVRDSVR